MSTPVIRLVAYVDRDEDWVFVAVPDQRGYYVRTRRCVVEVPCPHCNAATGEPCHGTQREWCATVHCKRLDAWKAEQKRRRALLVDGQSTTYCDRAGGPLKTVRCVP